MAPRPAWELARPPPLPQPLPAQRAPCSLFPHRPLCRGLEDLPPTCSPWPHNLPVTLPRAAVSPPPWPATSLALAAILPCHSPSTVLGFISLHFHLGFFFFLSFILFLNFFPTNGPPLAFHPGDIFVLPLLKNLNQTALDLEFKGLISLADSCEQFHLYIQKPGGMQVQD